MPLFAPGPIRHQHQRCEIRGRQAVPPKISLRRRTLQRGKAETPAPIQPEQQPHDAVAQPALAVEEQHRAGTVGGQGRDHARTFPHQSRSRKGKTPGRVGGTGGCRNNRVCKDAQSTAIFRGFSASCLGSETRSTPLRNSAATLSASTALSCVSTNS